MRAFRIHDFSGADGLHLDTVPTPEPGAGQVLVRVRAASLNYRDLLVAKGLYNPKLPLPIVPLSDAAGEVVAVGSGVEHVKPGDRVAGLFFQRWLTSKLTEAGAKSALGGAIPGVLAESVVLEENGVIPIPSHLSFEEAATLPCAAVTAWHALFEEGKVSAGETVLVQGTGGVSLFALQLAQLAGARVIVTSSSDEKLARAKELGASEVINYKKNPDWDQVARELTHGAGVDQIIEVGGTGTLPRSLKAAAIGGRISMIGVLSGGAGEIPLFPVLMKSLRIQGIYVGSRAMFEAMNRAISLHKLRPVIDRVFPFEEAPAALRHLESGSHFGKVVIRGA